jgi:molecular chaperone GrpE
MSKSQNKEDKDMQDAAAQDGAPDVEALVQAVATLTAEKAQAEDERLRALAEAQNARRIAAQEVENAKKYGAIKMVADVFSVLDNFDRAVQSMPESLKTNQDAQSWVQGITMIQGMLKTAFEKHGVQEIEAAGQKFDPKQHQAVMEMPASDDVPAGHVGNVMQRGYTMNGRVVRPAVVAVAK